MSQKPIPQYIQHSPSRLTAQVIIGIFALYCIYNIYSNLNTNYTTHGKILVTVQDVEKENVASVQSERSVLGYFFLLVNISILIIIAVIVVYKLYMEKYIKSKMNIVPRERIGNVLLSEAKQL